MSEIQILAHELVATRHQSKPAALARRAALGSELASLVIGTSPAALKLVAQSEVAVMADTKSSTVGVWVTRGQLPEPVAHLACGRIWLRADIEAWLAAKGAKHA